MLEEKDRPVRSYYGLIAVIFLVLLIIGGFFGYRWARASGYEAGASAVRESAYADGYDAGLIAGRQEAELESADEISRLNDKIESERTSVRKKTIADIAKQMDKIEPELTREKFIDCIKGIIDFTLQNIPQEEGQAYMQTLLNYFDGMEALASDLNSGAYK